MARLKRKWFIRSSNSWLVVSVSLAMSLTVLAGSAEAWQSADQSANQRYETAMAEWQDVYMDALKIWSEFKICEEAEAEGLETQYLKLKAKGDLLADKTILAAAECVLESTTPNPELVQFLGPLPKKYYDESEYEKSARVGRALRKHFKDDFPLMFNTLRSAFFSNDFEYAGELFKEILETPDWLDKDGKMPPELIELYSTHGQLAELWKKEQKLREMESVKDNLPRIQFETSKGNIVVELFEDQYPEFVNNLMVFIENESDPFFVDMPFFFCLQHQTAITGSKSPDGNQLVPFGSITPETLRETRGNFHGTFSLDVRTQRGQPVVTSACQFIQIPIPELNGSTLVLGRVIEGMDVLAKLEKTHELGETLEVTPREAVIPDRLLRVTVVRKPDGKVYKLPGESKNE